MKQGPDVWTQVWDGWAAKGDYARDIEEVYTEVSAPPYRVQALQQRLIVQQEVTTAVQQESRRLEGELQELRVQHAAVREEQNRLSEESTLAAQEQERALVTMRELQNLLGKREEQLRECTALLEAIYGSTTWKLYRSYAAVKRVLYRRPLDSLTRWRTQGKPQAVQILQNADSWIAPAEIGTRFPPYRRTFAGSEFINEYHRFFAFCPVKEEILIDLGIPGWLRREDALKLYEEADKLIAWCSKRLQDAEKRIEMIVKNREGEVQLEGFSPNKTRVLST